MQVAGSLAIVALLFAGACVGLAASRLVPEAVGWALEVRGIQSGDALDGVGAMAIGALPAACLVAVALSLGLAGAHDVAGAARCAVLAALASAAAAVASAAAVCDAVARVVPNGMVGALVALGAATQLATGGAVALAVAAGTGVLLAGFLALTALPFGRGALGGGDVKLAFALGTALGWPVAPWALCAALLAVAVVMGARVLCGRARLSSTFALGPYLCCALVIGQAALLTV